MRLALHCLRKHAGFQLFVVCILGLIGAGELYADQQPEVEAGEVPFASMPYDEKGLAMSFSMKKRCSFGDMDAVLLEAMGSPEETELILTIEPVSQGSLAEDFRHVLSKEQVMKEAHDIHRFGLGGSTKLQDGLYGIFVCKVNPGGSRRCNDKEPGDSMRIIHEYIEDEKDHHRIEIMERHQKKIQAKRSVGVSDKFYFFKPLLIQGGKVHILNELMSDGLYKKFSEHLRSHKLSDAQVPTAQSYDRTLGNLPLSIASDRIHVTLPIFDGEGCGQE